MTRLAALAAGGTGGHLFPAQALAEALLARGWRVMLVSDSRGLRYAEGFPEAVVRREIAAASPSVGGLTGLIGTPARIARGLFGAARLFRAERPAVVAGFGGYPSFPPLAVARAMGLPILIHEQNAVLGAVNRLFAGRARLVACGSWPVTNAPRGARLEPLGNPVRAAVAAAAATAYEAPGEGALRLLVFGGSQGASALTRLAPGAVQCLPEAIRARLEVVQQVRPGEEEAAASHYRKIGVRAELAPFFADLPARIAAAHLVIARAGASTVAEIAAIGRPSILVPFPSAAGDHQTANARTLSGPGAAVLAPEAETTPETLAAEIAGILGDPETARRMAAAARTEARPDAAERLADRIEEIAG